MCSGVPDRSYGAVTADTAEADARLCGNHKIRTPDTMQMATAIAMKAAFFLTNDFTLSAIPNLTVLMVENLAE